MMSTPENESSETFEEPDRKQRVFPQTRWSRIEPMREGADAERKQALEFLAQEYWKPIYCFIRSLGANEQATVDLVQGFFAFAIEEDLFSRANPQQGKFRNFLCASVKHYVFNEWRNAKAKKRFPAGGLLPIHDANKSDGILFHPRDNKTPEEAFDRAWMEGVIERASKRMAEEYRSKDMESHYTVFTERFLNPLLRVAKAKSYAELAKRFGVTEKKID